MTDKLILSLACNHHENGHFAGKFDAAELHSPGRGTLLRLYGPDTKVSERRVDGMLRVGRINVAYHGSRDWVGNWCWCEWTLRTAAAVKVLNYLKARGFGCEEAESGLFERWKQAGELTAEDLERAMAEPED